MKKDKKTKIEPVEDMDVFQHFKRIVDQIQTDLDAKYKANLKDRKIQEGKMQNLAVLIKENHRPVAEKLETEYFLLTREQEQETKHAVDQKQAELLKAKQGGITFAEAQRRIKEIEKIEEDSKKKIDASLSALISIAKEKEFEILGFQIEWLNAREKIISIERNNRQLAVELLLSQAHAEERRQATIAMAMPEANAELKKKNETFQNFKANAVVFRDQIHVDSFLELRALIFDPRIPKKFVPELQKLIEGVKDASGKYSVLLDDQYPRGEGLRLVEVKTIKSGKGVITPLIETEVKNEGE